MLNDDSLGDALDRLYAAGVTELFAQVAASACAHYEIDSRFRHLDNSSFHLHGEYEQEDGKEKAITVAHGYSRDKRPDLKQVVLSLVTTHQAAIPVWLEALSGNKDDKESFLDTVTAYRQQLKEAEESYFVADSALYTKDNLKQLSQMLWVTRVPLTVLATSFIQLTLLEFPGGVAFSLSALAAVPIVACGQGLENRAKEWSRCRRSRSMDIRICLEVYLCFFSVPG
jgi:transposase